MELQRLPGFRVLQDFGILLFGILCISIVFIFIILSSPIYLYRYLIAKLAKYTHPNTLGKPVTSFGNYFASELLPSHFQTPPRSTVVATLVVDGQIKPEAGVEFVKKKWFGGEDGDVPCRYPELQQYIESWMGFLFWKPDPLFQFDYHIKSYSLEGTSDDEVEDKLNLFTESLINKPFPLKRSPWEVFIVQNYRNSEISKECVNNDGMTLIVFRFHHCLADGFSILYAIIEGLLDTPLSAISLPDAKDLGMKTGLLNKILFGVKLPLKLFYDMGYNLVSTLFAPKISWHVQDDRKSWKQLVSRCQPIPMECIKNIKNRLGVSFTGVLLSCMSAGISKSLQATKRSEAEAVNSLPTSTILPLPGHPNKLRNHLTSTLLQLPTTPDLEPLKRLQEVEKMLTAAKTNMMPLIVPFVIKAFGSHFASVSQFLFKNRHVSTGFSNFPGPGVQLEWEGKKVLRADCAAGGSPGVVGVNFVVISFNNHIRIAVSVENAVMKQNDVDQLITFISEELEALLRLSMSKKSLQLMENNKELCV